MLSRSQYIDLNKLEQESDQEYLPITLPRQLVFGNSNQVRGYIKEHGYVEDTDDEHKHLITVMAEAFFGHYSTCLLNHKELIDMWVKLTNSWVHKLYSQNQFLHRPKTNLKEDYLEQAIDSNRTRIEEEYKNNKEERESKLEMFDARYRGKSDIIRIVSKYCFSQMSRFYVIPLHLRKEIVERYTSLRSEIISMWYEYIADIPNIRRIDPSKLFQSLEPKSVAYKLFNPNLFVHTEVLNRKMRAFNRWWVRERKISLASAEETNDQDFIERKLQEWTDAKRYAIRLSRSLRPRSKLLDQKDVDFIDNTEYSEDEQMYTELDQARENVAVQRMAKSLKHTHTFDEEAAERSGDYDAYVERAFKKSDRKARHKERKFKAFMEEADEADDDEMSSDETDETDMKEDNVDNVDDGNSDDGSETESDSEFDMSGNTYMRRLNERL